MEQSRPFHPSLQKQAPSIGEQATAFVQAQVCEQFLPKKPFSQYISQCAPLYPGTHWQCPLTLSQTPPFRHKQLSRQPWP